MSTPSQRNSIIRAARQTGIDELPWLNFGASMSQSTIDRETGGSNSSTVFRTEVFRRATIPGDTSSRFSELFASGNGDVASRRESVEQGSAWYLRMVEVSGDVIRDALVSYFTDLVRRPHPLSPSSTEHTGVDEAESIASTKAHPT